MPFGVEAIAWSYVGFNVISTIINIWPNKSILNYGYIEQFRDLGANLLVGLIIGVLVWAVTFLPISYWLMLMLQTVVGITLYILISKILKIESYTYINKMAVEQLKKIRKKK